MHQLAFSPDGITLASDLSADVKLWDARTGDLKQTVKQPSESAARTLADADREHILETLNQTDWLIGGQGGAANRLGLPRTTLIYKMRKLGIEIRRSPRARSVRHLPGEQRRAAAIC